MSPLVTLTTDFGSASPYVAVMKGVILSLNPGARLIDLSHAIRPQDVRHASYFLATAAPFYPPGTIHLCVVDPGVGSDRAALYAEAGGQRFVGPDNGVFTGVLTCWFDVCGVLAAVAFACAGVAGGGAVGFFAVVSCA